MSGAAAGRGDAVAWWIAQATGAVVGLTLGLVGVGAIWLSASMAADEYAPQTVLGLLPARIITPFAIAGVSLAIAAITAALASAILRPRVSR